MSQRMVASARTLVGVVSLGVILTNVAIPSLFAQVDDEPANPAAHEGPPMFELFAADPGAIEYSQLGTPVPLAPGDADDGVEVADYIAATRETQASVDDTFEWADLHNGPDVHAAYSTYTTQAALEAQLRHAEYQAGLAGIAEVGVH